MELSYRLFVRQQLIPYYGERNSKMVKHVILWKLKDEFSDEERKEIKENAKRELESLVGKIDGLETLTLDISGLQSSTADMMLSSEFTTAEALLGYSKHPLHCEVADRYVRPFTAVRLCLDFEV